MRDSAVRYLESLMHHARRRQPRDWEWIGPIGSQHYLTKDEAMAQAERAGGIARKMQAKNPPAAG